MASSSTTRERGLSGSYHRLDDDATTSPNVASQPSTVFAARSVNGSGQSLPISGSASASRVHIQSLDEDSFGAMLSDESIRLHGPAGASAIWPQQLSRDDVIKSARRFQKLKPISNSRLRWNLLWSLVIWAVFMFPIYGPYLLSCGAAFYGVSATLLFFNVVWALAVLFTAYYLHFLYRGMGKDYKALYPAEARCFHIIILTIYKDDMKVVMRTVSSIAKQTEAKRIVMVLAWEGRTPDRAARTKMMTDAFGQSFYQLLFSVHPYQLPDEIASKAANANWGLRYAVRHCFQRLGHSDPNDFIASTCDSDTLFHERYFEALTADYLSMRRAKHPHTHASIWQAPLFYNWNLDQSSFITRITGLLRTTMTMGCLIPYSVNPMSCFSFSLPLAIRGGYWHPQIFMDDVGFLLTMQIGSQQRVHIRCLPVPVLSGPTSGATWSADVYEWYVQVRRWAIGTADNFHFMMVKVARLPISAAVLFTFGYFLYYGLILCAGPLFTMNSCIYGAICRDSRASDWSGGPQLDWLTRHGLQPNTVILFLTTLPMLFYAMMFVLDGVWCAAILKVKEDISLPRNILHWLLIGPAMVMYSLTQLHGYNVLAVKGKIGACVHQLAGKATLGTGAGLGGDVLVAATAAGSSASASPSLDRAPSSSPVGGVADRMADAAFEEESAVMAELGTTPARINEPSEIAAYD